MQSISIRNLGPIKEFDSEIKDLTLLIGGQGTGKSTIAKAVYFFRTVRDDVQKEMEGIAAEPRVEFEWSNLRKRLLRKLKDYFDPEYISQAISIKFTFNTDLSIRVYRDGSGFSVEFSPVLEAQIEHVLSRFEQRLLLAKSSDPDAVGPGKIERIREAIRLRNNEIDDILVLSRRNIFVPAGRTRYSDSKDRLFYINTLKTNQIIDRYLNEIESVREFLYSQLDKPNLYIDQPAAKVALSLAREILGGELRKVNEVDLFFFSDERSLPIDAISSGQQEALWVANLLVAISITSIRNFFVLIEEPEAHLHPRTQFLLCKLIALAMRHNNSQIFITTHSPYILAAFNNMLLGAKVGKEKPGETAAILPEEFWIDHNRVFAGEVKNGVVEDILNRDLAMIKVECIDKITETINDEFDRLTDLEEVPLLEDWELEQEG